MRRQAILLIAFLMPHCPVTVVQRYRDGVCSLSFHLFFIICHPYIPLHLLVLRLFVDGGEHCHEDGSGENVMVIFDSLLDALA